MRVEENGGEKRMRTVEGEGRRKLGKEERRGAEKSWLCDKANDNHHTISNN